MIIVLGMHRSGTSMIAGILHHLGIFMGEDLMIGDPETGNTIEQPHGYYEDREFMHINENILTEAGGGWDNVPELNTVKHACLLDNPTLDILLKKRLKKYGLLWGFKDPRTCLTLPAYLMRSNKVRIILIVRDRTAVIRSLLTREKRMEKRKAETLYNDYYYHIWSNLRGLNYLQIGFEHMIKSRDIDDILDYLGLRVEEKKYQRAVAHIRPDLRAERRVM